MDDDTKVTPLAAERLHSHYHSLGCGLNKSFKVYDIVEAHRICPFNVCRGPFRFIRFVASPSIEDVPHFLIIFFALTFSSFLASTTTLNLNKFMKSSAIAMQAKENYLTRAAALSLSLCRSEAFSRCLCPTVYIISIQKLLMLSGKQLAKTQHVSHSLRLKYSLHIVSAIEIKCRCVEWHAFASVEVISGSGTQYALRPYESVHKLID